MNNLYFKITTIPQSQDVDEEELELYFNKYRESNKLETLQEAKEDYYKNAGKNPLWGKIYSLTIGYINGEESRITVLKGDEKAIIQSFINICNNEYFKGFQLCSWNFAFILPFLRVRATKNGIHHSNLHKDTQDISKKAWTITGLDLFDSWKGLGWFQSSLEEVAKMTFGLKADFVDGSDVYNLYKCGAFDKLDNSSINEIETLINVHRIIKNEKPLTERNIKVEVLEGNVEAVELPVLKRLWETKVFSADIKKELIDLKIAKKDKPTVLKLVLSHYKEQIDVMAKNKKELQEINKQRIEEVTEFFKTL